MQRDQSDQQRPATVDLAVFGLNVSAGSTLAAVQAAFLALLVQIGLPAVAGDVQAVSYSPLTCGGRGRARLRLTAALARAAKAAAPRLRGLCPEVSIDFWRTAEEQQWIRLVRRSEYQQAGRADRAISWRQPAAGTALRPAAPAFRPRQTVPQPHGHQAQRHTSAPATTAQFITATHPTPATQFAAAAPAPAQTAAAAAAPAPAQPVAAATLAPAQPVAAAAPARALPATAPAAQPAIAPRPASASTSSADAGLPAAASSPRTSSPAPAPAPSPTPTGPNGELEYTVEAFVAARRVGRYTEYLVKWLGYEMVGEEAAYSWQPAAQLQRDLDRRSYRRFIQQLRQEGSTAAAGRQHTAAAAGC